MWHPRMHRLPWVPVCSHARHELTCTLLVAKFTREDKRKDRHKTVKHAVCSEVCQCDEQWKCRAAEVRVLPSPLYHSSVS